MVLAAAWEFEKLFDPKLNLTEQEQVSIRLKVKAALEEYAALEEKYTDLLVKYQIAAADAGHYQEIKKNFRLPKMLETS